MVVTKSVAAHRLILIPLSAISIVVSRWVSRRGWIRWPLILTGGSFVLVAVLMLTITHDSNVVLLIAMSMLFGLANGFSGFANQATLYVQTESSNSAVASGVYRTFAYFGAIFSSSLFGLTFGSEADDRGFYTIAYVIAAIGGATLLMTILNRAVPTHADQ